MKGIDVSKFQGKIDWQRVKAAGIEFAFVRVGWAGYEGGIDEGKDPHFDANMRGAAAVGIPVGVYVYSYCKTPEAAKRAAKEAVALCAPYRLTMPLVFDIEHDQNVPIYRSMSRAQVSDICAAFLAEVEKAGYYAMLYTYKSFVNESLDMSKLSRWDFWLAHYTTKTDYTGAYGIWQYSSSGSVDGINGRVDMNIAYKDYPAMISGVELGGTVAPIPVRMACVATGGDQRLLCDALDGLGIGYNVTDNVIITAVEVSGGDQKRLTGAAKPLGIEWTVYVQPEDVVLPEEDDDEKAVSGMLTDEPEDERDDEEISDLRKDIAALYNVMRMHKESVDKLYETVESLQRDNAMLRNKMNILLRRANIEEV